MKKILFQGDSITDAYRNREYANGLDGMGCGYPLLIRARLDCDYPGAFEMQNKAISGDRIVDIYARMGRDILCQKPDVLSILVGVNDVWHGLGKEPNGIDAVKFQRVYDWLLKEVREAMPDLHILILEPFVLPGTATVREDDPEIWHTFEREVSLRAAAARELAARYGAAFVPLQEKFNAACEGNSPANWLFDGVHPTPAGHELIAREWMKAFEAKLT